MKKIIFLNGPPSCGKDTIANLLIEKYNGVNLKFAQPIRNAVCGLFDIEDSMLDKVKNNKIENTSYRIRDAMIDIGENIIKSKISRDWFGITLLNTIKKYHTNVDLIVVSDLGFIREFEVIYNDLKDSYNIELWKIYRPNTSFLNDSRNYIEYPKIKTRNISNNGDINSLKSLVFEKNKTQ